MNEARSAGGDDSPELSRAERLQRLEHDRLFHQIHQEVRSLSELYGQPWCNSGGEQIGWEMASTKMQFGRSDWMMSVYNFDYVTDDAIAYVVLPGEDELDGTPTQFLYFLESEGEGMGAIRWYHERARYTEENGQKVWCDGDDIAKGPDLNENERRELLERINSEITSDLDKG